MHLAERELAWLNTDLGEAKPEGFQSSLYLSLSAAAQNPLPFCLTHGGDTQIPGILLAANGSAPGVFRGCRAVLWSLLRVQTAPHLCPGTGRLLPLSGFFSWRKDITFFSRDVFVCIAWSMPVPSSAGPVTAAKAPWAEKNPALVPQRC